MPVAFSDMLRRDGQDNDGGLRVNAFYCAFNDILTFPNPPNAVVANTFSEFVTITAPFVMRTGRRFWTMQATLLTPQFESNLVGERDARSFENTYSFKRRGIEAEMLGFMQFCKNTDMVMIIQRINGVFHVIGSPGLPASIETGQIMTGAAVSDECALTFSVKSVGPPPFIYTGAIPLTPAV